MFGNVNHRRGYVGDMWRPNVLKMNGHLVRPSEYIKYLGIYLDSTLSGKAHCDILVKKLVVVVVVVTLFKDGALYNKKS